MIDVPQKFRVLLGGFAIVSTQTLLAYEGEPLITLRRNKSGHLEAWVKIYDERGQHVYTLEGNEITGGEGGGDYFFEGDGNHLTLSFAHEKGVVGKAAFHVQRWGRDVSETVFVYLKIFLPNGKSVEATLQHINQVCTIDLLPKTAPF